MPMSCASRSGTVRLFLALWPTPPVRRALQGLQARWHWPQAAAVVDPARLHITLHFLGQVPQDRVDEFRAALAVPFEPHVLALAQGRATVWPGGIAVLELQAPRELQALHADLSRALQSLRWPLEERRYRPHVTFARRAQGARADPDACGELPEWQVDEGYVLVRSSPAHGYEVLHAYRPN
jgi:RNA 2',3'-cyclic 3'-phosphodiesterase